MPNINYNPGNTVFQGPAVVYIGQAGVTQSVSGSVISLDFEPRIDNDEFIINNRYDFSVINTNVVNPQAISVSTIPGGTFMDSIPIRIWTSNNTSDESLPRPISTKDTIIALFKEGAITAQTAQRILGYLPDEITNMQSEQKQVKKPIRIIRTD